VLWPKATFTIDSSLLGVNVEDALTLAEGTEI
jgi:hypothetical protein